MTDDGLLLLDEGKPVRDPDHLRDVLKRGLDENLRTVARCALLLA